jgi:hypothetical protein
MPLEERDAPRGATPGQREAPDWPADLDAIERARDFLRTCSGTVAIACDNDVDGLCAAVIAERALAGGAVRVRTLRPGAASTSTRTACAIESAPRSRARW